MKFSLLVCEHYKYSDFGSIFGVDILFNSWKNQMLEIKKKILYLGRGRYYKWKEIFLSYSTIYTVYYDSY